MRIDRMLSIVVILLNRRRIKAQELADRFEVSLRTVYRDIDAINMAGIPIISNQGGGGGYEIPENYKLNKQYLSPSDMKSIMSALKGVNAALDDKELELIYEKIQSLLPGSNEIKTDPADEYIAFDTMGWDNSDRYAKKIQILYNAIKSRQLIQIKYVDSQGKSSLRVIEPMTIIQKGFSWYIFGFCCKREEFRIFKLSRIKNILNSEKTFSRKKKNYRDLFEKFHTSGKMVNMILRFSIRMKHIIEDSFENSSILDQDDNTITIKIRIPEEEWAIGMVLSFGDQVEIISPESMRRAIGQRIKKMSEFYKKKI
ncbi:MAG: YafY family transcriptional regulator [Desulfobacula sp.]|nr:YafY family transcriptional regulator [Desulfobacula sp.]